MKNSSKLYYDNSNKTCHTDSLGIEDNRGNEISKAAVSAAMAAVIDSEIKNSGDMVVMANETAAPQNMQEAFFLGWSLAKAETMIEEKMNGNPLSILMKMLKQ